MIRSAYFLAFRYLWAARGRTLILVFGTTVALFLPFFTFLAAEKMEQRLLARGKSSPILLGHKGNEFDLTMNSLYFQGQIRDSITMASQLELERSGAGVAIPLYVRHSASRVPIVGTSLAYFTHRQLPIAQGRSFALLGEAVAGAKAAQEFHLKVGDTIRSDAQNLYNISGAYPMILKVVGVAHANGTVDDTAFFVDVKTTWALDGLLHGHAEVRRSNALNPTADEGENLEATAAIFMFPEITDKNRASFHMHGDISTLPLSSVLVYPKDQRSHDQILGDYRLHKTQQAVRPTLVIQSILEIVLGVKQALSSYFVIVACSTLAFFGLVLSLSLRLRNSELMLMERIGGSKQVIFLMVLAEVSIILLISVLFSSCMNFIGLKILELLLI